MPVSESPLFTSAIGKVCGYLVVALRDGTLRCLNCRNGQRAWSANIPLGRPMEMTAAASCVLVLTEEGDLFALDLSDGTLRWEFSALGTLSSPAAEKGMVYVADTGSAYAIDEQTGRTVWTSRLPSASDVKPSVAGHVCCFATSDEQLIALSAADGSGLWSTALSGRVTAPIVSWEKKFYAVTSDRFIYAIDSCSGQVIWKRYAAGTQVTPLIVDGRIIVCGHSRMYDFWVLNAETGNVVWRDCFGSSPFSGPVSLRNAVLCITQDDRLRVFDTSRGYETRGFDLPSGCQLTGSPESGFWLGVPGQGVFCIRPDLSRLLAVEPFHLPFEAGKIAIIVGCVMVVVVFGLLFSVAGSITVPPTYETSVRIHVLRFSLWGFSVFSLYLAHLLFRVLVVRSPTLPRILFLILLVVPSFSIVYSYFRFAPFLLRRHIARDTVAGRTVDGEQEIQNIVSDLSRAMSLHSPPQIVFSSRNLVSPIAVGSLRRNSCVVLPTDFFPTVRRACRTDAALSAGLTRLVLAHEMAHIKNRDIAVLPLLWAIQKPIMLGAAGLFVVYSLMRWLFPDEPFQLLAKPLVTWSAIAFSFLLLMFRSVLKAREKLADATASLHVSPDLLEKLTEPEGGAETDTSPLERYVFSVMFLEPFARSFLGFSVRRGRSRWRGSLLSRVRGTRVSRPAHFRSRIVERLSQLREKYYTLGKGDVLDWKIVCLVSVLAALLFRQMCLVKAYDFVGFWPPDKSASLGDFFRAKTAWVQHLETSSFWFSFELVGKLLVSLTTVGLLMIPLRDVASSTTRNLKLACRPVGVALFACVFVLPTLVNILEGLTSPALATFPEMNISLFEIQIFVVAIAVLFFIFLFLRAARQHTVYRHLVAGAGAALPCVFLPSVIVLFFFSAIPVTSRLLLGVASWAVIGFASSFGLFDLVFRDVPLGRERLYYTRLLWRRRLRTTLVWEQRPGLRRDLGEGLMLGVVHFLLPITVFLAILYPTLIHLDKWYFQNLGTISEKLNELSELPIETIMRHRISFLLKFAPLYLTTNVIGPGGLFPSGAIPLALIAVFIVPLMLTMVFPLFSRKLRRGKLIDAMPMLLELSELLRTPLVSEGLQREYIRRVLPKAKRPSLFIADTEGVPLMKATCEAIEVMKKLNIPDARFDPMVKWISQCESTSGGVAGEPGLPPDVLHTAAAVRALTPVGETTSLQERPHVTWVRDRLIERLPFAHFTPIREWLEVFRLLAETLTALSPEAAVRDGAVLRIGELAIERWRAGERSCSETHGLLSGLSALGLLDMEIIDELRSSWLPRYERMLISLKPDSELSAIWQLVRLTHFLYPEDYLNRPSVRQVRDNLRKTYS